MSAPAARGKTRELTQMGQSERKSVTNSNQVRTRNCKEFFSL
jgi:hypothetical protein